MRSRLFLLFTLFFSSSIWSQSGDIIVSAEKFDRNYLESTSSIFVLDSEDIQELNAGSLAEVLKRKGGFSIQTNGAFGKASSINLRGTDNRHTLVLIDGVRVTDITSIGGGTRLEFIDPAQIERVEILKGNQGVLYGSEAVGGVISITTRKGSGSQLGLEYGSFGQKKISAYNSLKKDNNQFSISGSHRKVDGISAYNEERIGSNAEDDGLTQTELLLNWNNTSIEDLKLSSQVELKDSSYLYDDNDGDNKNLNGEYQTTRYSGSLSYFHSKAINIDFSYSHFEVDRKLFGENSFGKFNYLYKGSFDRYALVNRTFYGTQGELITGVEYEREKTKALDQLLDMTRAKERYGAYLNNYNSYGIFLLEEGLRYENLQFFGDEFVYRVGAGLHFANMSLKASYGTSFKAPTLYQSFAQFGGNRDLEMETSESKELSFLYKDERWLSELTYFEIDYDQYIDYDMNRSIYNNTGDYESYGWEWNTSMTLESWEAGVNYTFLKSRNILTGAALPRRSKHNLGFNIAYQYNDSWRFMSDIQYRADRIDSNTKRLPSFFLTNLSIEYKWNKNSDRISLNIKNLLDKSYEEVWGYGTPGRNFLLSYIVKF